MKGRIIITAACLTVAISGCSHHSKEANPGVYRGTNTTTTVVTSSLPDTSPMSTAAPTSSTTTVLPPSIGGTAPPSGIGPATKLPDPKKVNLHDPAAVATAAVCNHFALFVGETQQQAVQRLAPVITPQLLQGLLAMGGNNEPAGTHYDVTPVRTEPYPGTDGTPGYYVWCAVQGFAAPGQNEVFLQNPQEQQIAVMAKQSDGTWRVARFVQPSQDINPLSD